MINNNLTQRLLTSTVLTALFAGLFFYAPPIALSLCFTAALVYVLIYEWPHLVDVRKPLNIIFTLSYPIIPVIHLIRLNHGPAPGRWILLSLFVTVASFDTGSYITGSLFGKHKIVPDISPNKTWEGFIGGLIGAFIAIKFMLSHFPWQQTLLLSVVTSILALSGDLYVSWLKRKAGLKDTGALLPGHGGIMDRLDGILMATWAFWILAETHFW